MFRKTQHSVYSITLHLVLVVKYRRDVINNTISERIKEIFETIGLSHGVELTNGIMIMTHPYNYFN